MSVRARFFACITCTGRAGVAAILLLSVPLHAGPAADTQTAPNGVAAAVVEPPESPAAETFPNRRSVRALIEKETARTALPADIAEAVVFVESRYDSGIIGRVGEIGLMQVRPETAAMLGFTGTAAELGKPEVNIHYGVTYLARAWQLAHGDLCRALMKYRAGHGEEEMTSRSTIYCNRARNRLIAMNSPFAGPGPFAVLPDPAPAASSPTAQSTSTKSMPRPTDVYASYRQGTAAASRTFWAVHEARIRAIKDKIEAKWRRVASR